MRTKLFLAALLAAFLVASLGCNSRRRGGGGGGGDMDAGDDGLVDAGGGGDGRVGDAGGGNRDSGIVLMDSGPPPQCSAGNPCPTGEMCVGGECVPEVECTTDTHCPSTEECLGNECVPRSTSCPVDNVPLVGVSCTSSTYDCVVDCGSDRPCIQACLDADADPATCNGCVNQNLIVCYNSNGCQEEWNCWVECVDANGCTDRSCVSTYCSSEDSAYNACIDALPSSVSCSSEFRACFP